MANDDDGVGIFWIVLSVATFTYGGIGLAMFYFRMDRWPIRQRLPMEMLAGSVFVWIFALSLSVLNALIDYTPTFWMLFIPATFMLLATDTFTIVTLTLWLMFNRTQDQLKVAQSVDDAGQMRSAVRQLAVVKGLLGRRPRIAYVVANAIVYTIVAVAYTCRYPFLFTVIEMDTTWSSSSPARILEDIGVYKMGISMVLIITLSFRLRIVSDALGIKRSLKRMGCCSLVGLIVYVFASPSLMDVTGHILSVNAVVAILVSVVLLTLAIHIPVWHSYSQQLGALDQAVYDVDLFEVFLSTPEGFATFKKQLESEFALENLLFWKAVQDYRRSFTESSSTRTARMALDIFAQYLAPSAPFEVNLDGALLRLFKAKFPSGCSEGDLIQRGILTSDCFNKASTTVLSLMYTNSLGRFREAHPDVWKNFMDLAHENAILAQIGTPHTTIIAVKPGRSGTSRGNDF
ncbi:unnamed protein product (mitochondrion) [Plasmodiophora brassicae]|uniref:RGS domain-containing protein n=1 Tax=Plasmodiophora brassicae TaxID=37360 RepID=A0A0G4IM41_PLABS|nr:hypothetical protein PBRA_004847 [Plasmodiophora brassicae]SPQ93299.1 unnamed protein product [Plasmodiophora brassicae]